MSEIEKIQRYVERTDFPNDRVSAYAVGIGELNEIRNAAQSDMFHALRLLFDYGRAKGYRAAKSEMRN